MNTTLQKIYALFGVIDKSTYDALNTQYLEIKNRVDNLNDNLTMALEEYNATQAEYSSYMATAQSKIDRLNDELLVKELEDAPHPLENYWNTKRPTNDAFRYACRTIHTAAENDLYAIDPRLFLLAQDSTLPVFHGTDTEIALLTKAYVERLMQYKSDKNPIEFWQLPCESLILKHGDCEDGALLMGAIMLKSGVPYWKIRVNTGWVLDSDGNRKDEIGHAYITFLNTDEGDVGEWYVLDWCYWPEESDDLKLKWKDAENKYFSIWWSFNTKHIFQKDTLDR